MIFSPLCCTLAFVCCAAASSALQLGEAMSFPVSAQGLIRHPAWAPNRQLLTAGTGEDVTEKKTRE
jgi:hypothetical protein